MPTLKIGSIAVAIEELGDFSQTYRRLEAVDVQRTADGSAVVRTLGWLKLATAIRATGFAPGLAAIDAGQTHLIECATPRVIEGASTSIAIPAARRNDTLHEPIAFAQVDGRLTGTTITNLADLNAGTSDTATLTAVAGADSYRVAVWPKITCAITRNEVSGNAATRFTWNLEAEEI